MKHICQKGEKCDEITIGHFSKITETARRELRKTFNSFYSFNFKGGFCNRRTGYCPY